jgi:hypothetical protein
MKKQLINFSLVLLAVAITSSCGGDKSDASISETTSSNQMEAEEPESNATENSSQNEKPTTEKIKEKAKVAKDKVVEKVNEGKKASRPLINQIKGKIREKTEN